MGRLIVELLPSQGIKAERLFTFENGRFTIGRSYANDIILNDMYVSGEHVSISNSNGNIYITDLTSENGTEIEGGTILKSQSAKIGSGEEVCIGKTRFKVFLPDHPVHPAKFKDKLNALRNALDSGWVALVSSLIVCGLYILFHYFDEPSEKFWKKEVWVAVFIYLFIVFIYVGILGLISYLKFHRPYFNRHLAVANLGGIYSLFFMHFETFILFWVTNNSVEIFIVLVSSFVTTLAMLWASSRLTKDTFKAGDWVRLSIAAVILTLPALLMEDSVRLSYSGDLKNKPMLAPYLKPLSEPVSLESFLDNSKILFEDKSDS
ncbi:MAG: FHA domain-containing protein [Nitrospinota bacterium]